MYIPALFKRQHSRKFYFVVMILAIAAFVGIVRFYNPTALANMVQNPGFESGTATWALQLRNAGAGNFSTTTSTKNSGNAAAVVNITSATSDPHDVELATYNMPITAGQTYTVSFAARAAANRNMDVVTQAGDPPYTLYMRRTVALTTAWQTFTFTFTATETRPNVLVGFQNATTTGTIYVDDVQFYQGNPTGGPSAPAGWWDSNWQSRKKITINNSASSENLINFPIRVSLNSSRINYAKTQNAGQDIRFVDPDGTVLAHEIEVWNESGTSEVWVKVPQINANSNSDYVWMYYNNPSAPNGANPTNVWNSNYRSVYHMSESGNGTAGEYQDSTSLANDGRGGGGTSSMVPTRISNVIGFAQSFDGSDDSIALPNTSVIDGTAPYTISAWVRPDDCGDVSGESALYKKVSSVEFGLCIDNPGDMYLYYAASNYAVTAGNVLGFGNWSHVAAVYNGSGTVQIYVNGVAVAMNDSSVTEANAATASVIGQDVAAGQASDWSYDGSVEELRLSNTNRSANWIEAEHLSMIDGANFYGPEETVSGGAGGGSVTNILKNPGCDTDTTSWGSWQGIVSRVTSPTRSGAGSCFVQQAAGNHYTLDDIGTAAVVNPTQGSSYTGSVWVRSDTAVGKPVRIAIRAWTGGTEMQTFFGPYVTLSTDWQQVTNIMTVNASTYTSLDYYVVQENAVAGDSFYADDMGLYAGTSIPASTPAPPGGSTPTNTFVKAINFNGPQLIIDGMTFEAEAATNVQLTNALRFSNQTVTLDPAADTSKSQMLRSSIWKGTNTQMTVGIPLPNTVYNVFLYTWEESINTSYNLAFEGATVASNMQSGTAGSWRRLGPYTVNVSDGALTLTQTGGDFNLSGIEIHSATGTQTVPNTITQRAKSSTNDQIGSTLTLTRPAGTNAGDVMIAHVVVNASAATITPPAGWNLIRRDNSAGLMASAIYFRVATATEPNNYVWTFDTSRTSAGGIVSYFNVDQSNPIDAHSGLVTANSSTMRAPSVTTTTNADRLLYIAAASAGTTVTGPSGMNVQWNLGNASMSYLADRLLTASGPTGDVVATNTLSGESNIGHLVALRPTFSTVDPGSGGSPGGGANLPGSIANLNFFMSNFNPWIVSVCGDIRIDSGVNIPLPANRTAITTNATCTTPGLAYSGDSSYSFGLGQASSTNQIVGGLSYPEVYEPPQKSGIFSSYANVTQKITANSLTTANLPCTLTNCTLANNLAEGIYTANGNVTLNTVQFNPNRDYIFLINGNLTINGNLGTDNGTTAMYIVSGDIIINPIVGEVPTSITANLEGIFSTDESFIINGTNTCTTERRLNVEGSIIVNAARNGGTLQNNRDLCGTNLTQPTMQVTQRLDFILNVPEFLRYQRVISNEVAP